MQINIEKLEAANTELKGVLRDALIVSDIWDYSTGLSLAAINPQPVGVALFTQIITTLNDVLSGSGFPTLNRYFFLDFEDNQICCVLLHGQGILQAVIMDAGKVNLGVLLAVAIPKMLAGVEAAQRA
jgi:hypothetical protein